MTIVETEDIKFSLTPGERDSPLWRRILSHLSEQLDRQRRLNDVVSNTEQKTASIRGQIACLKGLIALDEQMPVVIADVD